MAQYGLYQGLNEAYDSFRGRQRDIEAESDREAARITEAERQRRESEQYEYGLSRRPMQEEATTLALEDARRQGKVGKQEAKEFLDQTNIDARTTAVVNQGKLLTQQLQTAGIKLNQAELDQKADTNRRKFQEWSEAWNTGNMTMEQLKKAFNTDDNIANDIGLVTKKGDGWVVEFKSGATMEFADRRAVTQHLQESSSPEFLQTMLLNELKNKSDLAAKMYELDKDATKDLNARGDKWIKNSKAEIQATYGRIFPNGVVDFGKEGSKILARDVRAMTNRIGRAFDYDVGKITPSEVAQEIGDIAGKVMDTNPETRRKRAAEYIDQMPDEEFDDPVKFPDGRPSDSGDAGYDSLIKNLVFQQARDDLKALEQEVYARFTILNQKTGGVEGRDNRPKTGGADDEPEISKVGLQERSSSGGRVGGGITEPPSAVEEPLPEETGEPGLAKRELLPQPTPENPMSVSQYIGNVLLHIGEKGGAFGPSLPTGTKAPKLSQKAKRKLAEGADKAYNGPYKKEFTEAEKVKWLNEYGSKFMSKKLFQEALRKLSPTMRAKVSGGTKQRV